MNRLGIRRGTSRSVRPKSVSLSSALGRPSASMTGHQEISCGPRTFSFNWGRREGHSLDFVISVFSSFVRPKGMPIIFPPPKRNSIYLIDPRHHPFCHLLNAVNRETYIVNCSATSTRFTNTGFPIRVLSPLSSKLYKDTSISWWSQNAGRTAAIMEDYAFCRSSLPGATGTLGCGAHHKGLLERNLHQPVTHAQNSQTVMSECIYSRNVQGSGKGDCH